MADMLIKRSVKLLTLALLLILLYKQSGTIHSQLCGTPGSCPDSSGEVLKPVVEETREQLPLEDQQQNFELETAVPSGEAEVDGTTRNTSIAKVTMSFGDVPELYQRAVTLHQEHAVTMGYEMYVLRSQILSGIWAKAAYLLSLLLQELEKPEEKRLRWLFWVDADVVLMNPNIPLEIFLPPEPRFSHINLLATIDHKGLNAGIFFLRVGEWSMRFFTDVIAMMTFKPEVRLRFAEQTAMSYMINNTEIYRNGTMFVPQRWFNAYRGPRTGKEELKINVPIPENTVKQGDMQMHFAGKGAKKRMPYYVALAEKHSEEWELPLHETTYENEIATFWEEHAADVL